MEFMCAACGKRHIRPAIKVDEFVRCECGLTFYAFYREGMSFTIPVNELRDEVIQLFQNLVLSTGRCAGAKASKISTLRELLKNVDSLALIELGLERYQMETFDNRQMNAGDVACILEIINEKMDALVKGQDGYVSIMEQKPRRHKGEPVDYLHLLDDEYAVMPNNPMMFLQEPPLRPWQEDIMEQDAERTGYLFGDVI